MATNKNFVVKNGLEVDGDTLFVDSVNHRVGINDSTPSYDLDVNGTVRFVGDVNLDSELVIDNTNNNGITITGGAGDTYPHITLGGGGPQTIKFLDASDAQGLELVYRTSPDELKIEKGSAYTLFSADRDDGSIKLYYGNALKFETTNTGVKATGNITLTGNAYFADDQIANFGTGNDLQIYHSSANNNSIIKEVGTGVLNIGADTSVNITNANVDEFKAKFVTDGAVQLYYDNVLKFETTSSGSSTTGVSNADVFQSDGGSYSAASETKTDAAMVISDETYIYTDSSGYLRNLIGKDASDNIEIGQHHTVLILYINLRPGTNGGAVKLHHSGTTDNVKLQTTGSGVSVTGTASATALSTGASGVGINITTNTISGPATLTLDPAGVGNNTGTVVIAGNLQVDGTTTTINSTTVNIDDLNLTLASGAANAAAANGAGITIDGANATLTYVSAKDSLNFNKNVVIGNDDNGGHVSYVSSAALRVDGDAGVGLFATNNAQSADPVAVFYKNDDANNVPAVIISSDADDGQESILDVRGRVSASTSDLSATSNSADTILDVRGDTNVYVTGDLYTGGRYGQTNYKVLTTADESGLNVDKVDGLDASQFLRSDANDTATGLITISNELKVNRYGNTHFQTGSNYDTYLTYGAAAGGVFFRTYNGTAYSTKVTIDKDGNFGIGVTPSYKLHVSGETFVTGNINNGGFDFRLGASDQTSRGNSGTSRALVKNAGAKLVINYAGDFTGGTEVQSKLVVTGTGGISTTAGYVTANTGNGWIQMGPVNTSYAHISTDRTRFYFNKRLVVDEGIVSSYNEDLLLYANNASTLGVRVTNSAATTLYYNSSAKLATTSTGISVTGDTSSTTFSTSGGMVITGGPGTIAGATFNNGWLRIGTSSLGWTFDNNEFYTAGACIIGSLSGSSLTFSNIPAFSGGTSGSTAPFTVDSTFLVTNLNADLLDGLQSTSFLRSDANNDSATGTFRTTASYIEAGRGSGSVALTINDGQGNANITFNHLGGVPDVNGSSGRIECSVDETTANMYFELGNSSTANTSRTLTTVIQLTTGAISLLKNTSVTGTLSVSGTTTLGAQTWGGHITWNTGQNIYIAGESSFDVQTGGTWAVWDGSTSNVWMTATNGQPLYLNNNALNTVVNTASSTDKFQIRHRTDTDIYMDFYCESGTAQIADTFTDTTTDKKYIYFSNPNGSNDPGYIMHETSNLTSPDERNEGVLHLVPSDDNGYGDYISIHGTNDPDCLKLHTDGTIETAGSYELKLTSGSGRITLNDYFYTTQPNNIISTNNNQLLLHFTDQETVIHRNDGAHYYLLLSAAGASASGTWNGLRPFYINTGTGLLYSNNGQSFLGNLTTDTINLNSGKIINHNGTDSYDKIRVWNSSSYTIGMKSGCLHGRLNDYAMTFTMNNESDRGFLWRDSSHNTSSGAMSLSTDGGLAVSRGINIGGGEGNTGYSDQPLYVDNSWQTGQNNSYNCVNIDADWGGTAAFTTNRSQIGLRVDVDNSKSNTTATNLNRHSIYGIHTTADSTQFTYGTYGAYNFAKTAAAGSGIGTQTVMGTYGYAQAYAANGAVNAFGGHFLAYRGGGTSGGTLYGVFGRAQNTTNGTGKSGNAYGGYFEVQNDADTINNAYGVQSVIDHNGGTTGGGCYLFRGDYQGDPQGTEWGVYITGEDKNYFSSIVEAATFNATSTTSGGFQGIDADSASSPSFTWSSNLTTGMYKVGTNIIGFSTSSNLRTSIHDTYMLQRQALYITTDGGTAASSAQTIRDSETLYLTGKHWNGSSSVDREWGIRQNVYAANGSSRLTILFNNSLRSYLYDTGKLEVNSTETALRIICSSTTTANDGAVLIRTTNTSFANDMINIQAYRAANTSYNFLRTTSNLSGTSDNEHRLRMDGQAYADGSWNAGGADYAEYFEWLDGNPDSEDRRGLSVVLEGDKIRPAIDGEDPIGVISGNPSVVGDAAWNKWTEKHLKDDFGSYIMEPHTTIQWEEEIETTNDAGEVTKETKLHSYEDWSIPSDVVIPDHAVYKTHDENGRRFTHRKLNPDYDPNREYIPREERPEWDAVGMMGKLRLRKGQPVSSRWIKMRDISDVVEEWLVR